MTSFFGPPAVDLDEQCSKHFTFRKLIECGETYKRLVQIERRTQALFMPKHPETWRMLRGLAVNLLDPVVDEFGALELTYGFASRTLTRNIPRRIAPQLDQHAACELKARGGGPICSRGGAAADFRVPRMSTARVVLWAFERVPCLPIDRLYYYGPDKPVHVSWAPTPSYQFVEVGETAAHRLYPKGRLVRATLENDLAVKAGAAK